MEYSCPYWSERFTRLLKYGLRKRKKLINERGLILNNRASFLYLKMLKRIVDEWKYVTRNAKISSGVPYETFVINIEKEASNVTNMRNQIIPYTFITKIQTTQIMERQSKLGWSHYFEIYVFNVKGISNILKMRVIDRILYYQRRFDLTDFKISYSKVMQKGKTHPQQPESTYNLKYNQSQYQSSICTIVELMEIIGLDELYTHVDCLREFILVLAVDTTVSTKSIKHPLSIDRRNFSSFSY